jgi:hypothetical protein
MSVGHPQGQVTQSYSGEQHECSPNEAVNQLSSQDSKSSTDSIYLDQVNDTAVSATYKEEVASPTSPGPFEKENSPHGGSPTVEESLEARLGRLGRQRPEAFGSVWAEIGFVFSISMSQILSVILSSNLLTTH